MKKIMFVVLAMALAAALGGCANANQPVVEAISLPVAQPTMVAGFTLDQFFREYGSSLNPAFRVVSFDENTSSMDIVYNRMDMTLVNTYLDARVFLGHANGTRMDFVEMPLFSQEFFDAVNGQDLVVMSTTRPYCNQIALLAIPADQMPKMANSASWDETNMNFSIWSYPYGTSEVVQNSETGEILVVPYVVSYNEDGHPAVIQPGSSVSGYVHFEPDPVTSALTMFVGNK